MVGDCALRLMYALGYMKHGSKSHPQQPGAG